MLMVAALAAGAAIAVSGCSAGQISQTADQVAAVNGSSVDAEKIALRNVHIVYPGEGYTNVKGGSALIALSIINTSETKSDTLVSVTSDLGQVKLTPAAGSSAVVIEPQQNVVAASPVNEAKVEAGHGDSHGGDSHGAPSTVAPSSAAKPPIAPENAPIKIEITGLTRDITPGLTYSVLFNFERNGPVKIEVPVDAGIHAERHESDKSGPAAESHGSGGH
ncbi:hypothetical protein IT779_19825 [Nocardia sp. NEAU-351]|uniref:Lipoprotein LpqE n=2 Tax=Nocardia bovistercoris TaxID=2785916 RepID=A0A931IEB2_9NOCA|nr:hypothetical protein [Nocardia bovistercoris]